MIYLFYFHTFLSYFIIFNTELDIKYILMDLLLLFFFSKLFAKIIGNLSKNDLIDQYTC